MVGGACLFKPIEAIAMTLTIDEVKLAIVVHVIAKNGEAGIADVPVAVPRPLVVIGVDLLEPSVGCEDVGLAVPIDVGDADAVAILGAATEMMNARLVLAEVNPEDTGAVVVREREIRLA